MAQQEWQHVLVVATCAHLLVQLMHCGCYSQGLRCLLAQVLSQAKILLGVPQREGWWVLTCCHCLALQAPINGQQHTKGPCRQLLQLHSCCQLVREWALLATIHLRLLYQGKSATTAAHTPAAEGCFTTAQGTRSNLLQMRMLHLLNSGMASQR